MAAVIQRRIRKMMQDGQWSSQVVIVPGGVAPSAAVQYVDIVFNIDGAGMSIVTGIKLDLRIDFACLVTAWTLLLNTAATMRLDVWKDTYGNFPPTVGDSMPGADADKPQTVAVNKATGAATGWDFTTIAAGDTLRLNVDTNDLAQRATLVLKARRI